MPDEGALFRYRPGKHRAGRLRPRGSERKTARSSAASPGSLVQVTEDQPNGNDRDRNGSSGPGTDLPEQMRVRMAKLDALRQRGADPYPVGFPRTAVISEVRGRYAGLGPDTATGDMVGITGRVM